MNGRKRLDLQVVAGILAATSTLKERPVDSDLLHTEKILADRKTFYLDLKQNQRGMVVKITEDVSGNRDTIMVPAEILADFIAALSDIKATADEQA
ncbi:MAG: RNA-binding protein [Verrucomicrobia bacterium]|nr:MAG: RNA-binding protein [Verrucomicrobiota bacterium]